MGHLTRRKGIVIYRVKESSLHPFREISGTPWDQSYAAFAGPSCG